MTTRMILMSAAGASGGPSGYYYEMTTQAQYYEPYFTGVQPTSNGWLVSGERPNDIRFTMALSSTGDTTSYKTDSLNITSVIPSMNKGGSSLLSNNTVPAWLRSGYNRLAFISNSPAYVGTPATSFVPSFANLGGIMGIDYSNNNIFSWGYYSDGESQNYIYVGAISATSGTTVWAKRYDISPWTYPDTALIRPGDSTNVWITTAYGSNIALMRLDRTTGAATTGFYFSGVTTNNATPGFVSDPSGNLYISTYNGQIFRINTSNTLDWAYSFGDASTGTNFGYTHMCYYDGYLYAIGSQHPNGNYLVKINPSNATIVWAIKISSPLYGCSGISASANGIMIFGQNGDFNGYKKAYLLNYPLTAGILGTKGLFTFSEMSVSMSSIPLTINTTGTPTLTSIGAPGSSSYPSSLGESTSITNGKVVI